MWSLKENCFPWHAGKQKKQSHTAPGHSGLFTEVVGTLKLVKRIREGKGGGGDRGGQNSSLYLGLHADPAVSMR